jgi:hypothetical protein
MAERDRRADDRLPRRVGRDDRGVARFQAVSLEGSGRGQEQIADRPRYRWSVLQARLGGKEFATAIKIDGREYESPTHSVDCFKGRVALEVEWNNKDPFFDRDLNNFRLLFDLRAIDVGVIVTRGTELQKIFNSLGKGKSYGNSTTHHAKLWPRLDGGGGGGCPVLTFAITPALYVDDGPPTSDTLAELESQPATEDPGNGEGAE